MAQTGQLIQRTLDFCGTPDTSGHIPWLGTLRTKKWSSAGVKKERTTPIIYDPAGAILDPKRILLGMRGRMPEPLERIQQSCPGHCVNVDHMRLRADG